jgi:hypothetical protein
MHGGGLNFLPRRSKPKLSPPPRTRGPNTFLQEKS